MPDKNTVAAGLAGGGAGFLAGLAIRQKPGSPSQNELIVPQDLLDLLNNIQNINQGIVDSLNNISSQLGTGGVSNLQNSATGIAFRAYPAAVGVPLQLPEYFVPYDRDFLIKALPGNSGIIYVGFGQAQAANPNSSWPLIANEAVGYKIYNTKQIWIACTIAGEGAACTVEQKGNS